MQVGPDKKRRYPDVTVIANSPEKFISFQMCGLRFIDSYLFLTTGLDKLVENLKQSGLDKFKHTTRHFDKLTAGGNRIDNDIIYSKGIYPYEYMDSFDRFDETQLPSKDKFYSRLNEEDITDEQYDRAVKTFEKLNCKNLRDYHNFYVSLDTILLADIFENFRDLSLKIYGLDPTHFYTLPGLSWDACLRHTDQTLELLTDDSMYLFLESAIVGVVSAFSHRHAVANNPYLEDKTQFDPSQPLSYLLYLDANNLYGT